ncbi:MarR family winged helix-turn-helix transcriptional regulator [Dictyobacter aurantiacus]|uniref:MarR family transcriptional regulator n=1 Tax=Dictyobacter aurantiacus TaxID=1936993 RepID=A0A401Z937_9CHLR|nr:MarR family transcriptional regulator [Dictyobacter aurantiacus]GCE03349.1 MarR family transcriptional regulator [Dictyobacter aurantiacus]
MFDEVLTDNDYSALSEFRYAIRRFLHFSEEAARAAALEPQQHQLLLAVKGLSLRGSPTIRDIAERLQLRHHSTVELLDRMAEHGLIERTRDTVDQRRVFITLTPTGEDILKKLSLLHRTELRSSGPALVEALNALIGEPTQSLPDRSGATS